ncbi:ATP-binding protein [Eubacterium ruminantium]|uniref:ATP-binding protein n=1 Tax=Eubacterium ruminantium TaxID=42322 RepID=UPI001569EBD5|nr:ATP-binding protein [Eubacterium ruminantium]
MSYTFDMDEILKKLDRRRNDSARDLRERREALYEKLPEIKEIDDELRNGTLMAIRKKVKGTGNDIAFLAELEKRNSELSEKKKNILIKNGYDENYLERRYVCNLCKDEGYIGNEKCKCLKQLIVEARYLESNISDRLEQENFSTFDMSYYRQERLEDEKVSPYENIQNILAKSKEFIKKFGDTSQNIIIFGETGRGKTFLTNCIAKEILDEGHSVFYLTAGGMVEDVINGYLFRRNEEEYDDKEKKARYEFLFNADLLIIDDLGTESVNRQSVTQLFRVVNDRIISGKSTIISSNLDIKGIKESYTERFAGRISENYDFFTIFGANIRMVKKKRLLERHSLSREGL